MRDILFAVETKRQRRPIEGRRTFVRCVIPRVSREARFTLGYFLPRLQRSDSTRCARYLLQPTYYNPPRYRSWY
jgi:hypothetical protein